MHTSKFSTCSEFINLVAGWNLAGVEPHIHNSWLFGLCYLLPTGMKHQPNYLLDVNDTTILSHHSYILPTTPLEGSGEGRDVCMCVVHVDVHEAKKSCCGCCNWAWQMRSVSYAEAEAVWHVGVSVTLCIYVAAEHSRYGLTVLYAEGCVVSSPEHLVVV